MRIALVYDCLYPHTVGGAEGGDALRASTSAWFRRNAARLSLARSAELVSESYRPVRSGP